MEKAAILGYVTYRLEGQRDAPLFIFDDMIWIYMTKRSIVDYCLNHLEGKDLKSVDRYITSLVDDGYLIREWHNRNPARDAPYYTLGPAYRLVDPIGYEDYTAPSSDGKKAVKAREKIMYDTISQMDVNALLELKKLAESKIKEVQSDFLEGEDIMTPSPGQIDPLAESNEEVILTHHKKSIFNTKEEEKTNTPKPKKPTRHRAGDTPQLALPLDMSAPLTPESLLHLWNSFDGSKHKPQQLTKERTTQINKIIQGLSPTNDEAEYVVENYRQWSTTQGQDYDSLSNATRYDKFEKRLIDYREGRGKKRLGKVLYSQEESVALSSNPICF